jgi:hypothetical protein
MPKRFVIPLHPMWIWIFDDLTLGLMNGKLELY